MRQVVTPTPERACVLIGERTRPLNARSALSCCVRSPMSTAPLLAPAWSQPPGTASSDAYGPDASPVWSDATEKEEAVLMKRQQLNADRGIELLRSLSDEHGFLLLAPASESTTWDGIGGAYGPDPGFINRSLARAFTMRAGFIFRMVKARASERLMNPGSGPYAPPMPSQVVDSDAGARRRKPCSSESERSSSMPRSALRVAPCSETTSGACSNFAADSGIYSRASRSARRPRGCNPGGLGLTAAPGLAAKRLAGAAAHSLCARTPLPAKAPIKLRRLQLNRLNVLCLAP